MAYAILERKITSYSTDNATNQGKNKSLIKLKISWIKKKKREREGDSLDLRAVNFCIKFVHNLTKDSSLTQLIMNSSQLIFSSSKIVILQCINYLIARQCFLLWYTKFSWSWNSASFHFKYLRSVDKKFDNSLQTICQTWPIFGVRIEWFVNVEKEKETRPWHVWLFLSAVLVILNLNKQYISYANRNSFRPEQIEKILPRSYVILIGWWQTRSVLEFQSYQFETRGNYVL